MKEKERKPIYKKWWFWLIALFVIITIYGSITGENQAKETPSQEKSKDEVVVQEEEPLDEKIEMDKTIELNGATIVIQSLRVKDDSTQLYGYWNHNSQYDKAHLDLLVTTTFKQNDEELEITNKDKLLDQKNKTIDGSLDLKIERIDDSPIEITFTANTDERETESITIDIP